MSEREVHTRDEYEAAKKASGEMRREDAEKALYGSAGTATALGRKATAGLRYDLLPSYPLAETALVYTIGCRKYAERNWEKGLPWSSCVAALLRHLFKFLAGEVRDPDGQHHLASVVFHAWALMQFEKSGRGVRDIPLSPETLAVNEEAKK